MDSISWITMEHFSVRGDDRFKGIFEWGFLYKETSLPFESDFVEKSKPYWYV